MTSHGFEPTTSRSLNRRSTNTNPVSDKTKVKVGRSIYIYIYIYTYIYKETEISVQKSAARPRRDRESNHANFCFFYVNSCIVLYFVSHIFEYREKYEIPMGWVMFEPTPALKAAPNSSESGDITTAPLRLLKNKFHGTVLYLISLNDQSDRVYFWCARTHCIQGTLWSTGYWSLELSFKI